MAVLKGGGNIIMRITDKHIESVLLMSVANEGIRSTIAANELKKLLDINKKRVNRVWEDLLEESESAKKDD